MKRGGEAGKNYRGPADRKRARGPAVLQNVLSLSRPYRYLSTV